VRREWIIGLGKSGRLWRVVGNEGQMERPHASCISLCLPSFHSQKPFPVQTPMSPQRWEGGMQKKVGGRRPEQGRRTAWMSLVQGKAQEQAGV